MTTLLTLGGLGLLAAAGLALFAAVVFRRVVSTNEVHTVQYRNKTISYGKDTDNGNVYYEWPSFLPFIGVSKIVLPVSVFSLELNNYEAYDIGRVPFVVDIQAFFRIKDPNLAAARICHFEELEEQLSGMLKGASRAMLASAEIESIMQERASFGEQFTKEVADQLLHWGVEAVKNVELMDIRDSNDSKVIHNIMAKKKSLIEKDSRVEVAKNKKEAEIAEVQATRDSDMEKVLATETVEKRVAEQKRTVGVANEQAAQDVKEQQRLTKEKEMAVQRVADVEKQKITREMGVVEADEYKQKEILIAEAKLEAAKRNAKGIEEVGKAEAEAEKAMKLAPVQAQIALAKEIGENDGYQNYLVTIEGIKANMEVGIKQAEALKAAKIDVIANSGDVSSGISSIGDLLTPKGGSSLAATLEALSKTPTGKALVERVTGKDIPASEKRLDIPE